MRWARDLSSVHDVMDVFYTITQELELGIVSHLKVRESERIFFLKKNSAVRVIEHRKTALSLVAPLRMGQQAYYLVHVNNYH